MPFGLFTSKRLGKETFSPLSFRILDGVIVNWSNFRDIGKMLHLIQFSLLLFYLRELLFPSGSGSGVMPTRQVRVLTVQF